MDNNRKGRREFLKGLTATAITGGIGSSGLWLPHSVLAQNQGAGYNAEFLDYKRQMMGGFNQYKAELEAEFSSYVEHGTIKYEKKHAEVLRKNTPTSEDIKRNNNDRERAEFELDILQDTVTDEYEHGEKQRLVAEAAKVLIAKRPKDEKIIMQLEQQIKQQDKPAVPLRNTAVPRGSMISVLHSHNPKPFLYPFSRDYRLSSYFGIRNLSHRGKKLKKHCGIDIAAPRGTPILALADGVVKMQFHNKFGGKSIIIEAARPHEGKRMRYSACHMQRFNTALREGSRVIKGKTIIGYVGSTGRSTGPHIHLTNYEFNDSNAKWMKVNPLKLTAGCKLPGDSGHTRYQFETCAQIARKI